MTDRMFDFAVIGSTPLARLLAGELAGTHGKSVAFVGQSQASYRLPRATDLSVAPMTRPESWAMLIEGKAEVSKRLARIGARHALRRVDPVFLAHSPSMIEALAHMRHMAEGFGLAAEPASKSALMGHEAGIVIRDAIHLHRPALEPLLDRWLKKLSVPILTDPPTLAADGSAKVRHGDDWIDARQTILADDDALLAHLSPASWPALLRRAHYASVLTLPTKTMASTVAYDLQSGLTLLQQTEGGIIGIGPGDTASFPSRLSSVLGLPHPMPQAGQTTFTAVSTTDGAPALGRLNAAGPKIIAAFGAMGAFFAPALARWFCDTATPFETEWFGNRLVTRPAIGTLVGEVTAQPRSFSA